MAQRTLAAPRAPTTPARLTGILCRHTAAVNRHVDRPDQRGGADGAFARVAQFAAVGAGGPHVRHVAAEFPYHFALGPVVGGEDDEGVLLKPELLQRIEHLAHDGIPSRVGQQYPRVL